MNYGLKLRIVLLSALFVTFLTSASSWGSAKQEINGVFAPETPTTKVFVYDVSDRRSMESIPTDPLDTMYSSEFFLVQWIKRSAFAVQDPAVADLFLVPQYATHLAHKCTGEGKSLGECADKIDTEYLLPIVNEVKREVFFKKKQGRDHMWIFPWDHGSKLFRQSRAQILNCIHIGQDDEELARPLIIPPPIPISWTWKMTQESLFLASCIEEGTHSPFCTKVQRAKLIFFSGTIHESRRYSYGVRQDMKEKFAELNKPDVDFEAGHVADYKERLLSSVFCLCPPGWAAWSPRIYAAVASGCLPVIFPLQNFSMRLPFPQKIAWDKFTIKIPSGKHTEVYEILSAVPKDEILRKRLDMTKFASRILVAQSPDFVVENVILEAQVLSH